LVIIKLF
jgi:hypothetical protein